MITLENKRRNAKDGKRIPREAFGLTQLSPGLSLSFSIRTAKRDTSLFSLFVCFALSKTSRHSLKKKETSKKNSLSPFFFKSPSPRLLLCFLPVKRPTLFPFQILLTLSFALFLSSSPLMTSPPLLMLCFSFL